MSQGTMAVVYVEADDPSKVFEGLATSQEPFDVWRRSKFLEIHGLDLTQPLPGPLNESIFDYTASTPESPDFSLFRRRIADGRD